MSKRSVWVYMSDEGEISPLSVESQCAKKECRDALHFDISDENDGIVVLMRGDRVVQDEVFTSGSAVLNPSVVFVGTATEFFSSRYSIARDNGLEYNGVIGSSGAYRLYLLSNSGYMWNRLIDCIWRGDTGRMWCSLMRETGYDYKTCLVLEPFSTLVTLVHRYSFENGVSDAIAYLDTKVKAE